MDQPVKDSLSASLLMSLFVLVDDISSHQWCDAANCKTERHLSSENWQH